MSYMEWKEKTAEKAADADMKEKVGEVFSGAFVDQDMCIGCGTCEGTCPEVFRMNDEGKTEAYADTTDETRDAVLEAVDGCPVSPKDKVQTTCQ